MSCLLLHINSVTSYSSLQVRTRFEWLSSRFANRQTPNSKT